MLGRGSWYLLKFPWLLFQRFKSYGFSIRVIKERRECDKLLCLFNELAHTVRLTFRSMLTLSIQRHRYPFLFGEVSKDVEKGRLNVINVDWNDECDRKGGIHRWRHRMVVEVLICLFALSLLCIPCSLSRFSERKKFFIIFGRIWRASYVFQNFKNSKNFGSFLIPLRRFIIIEV